MICPKCKTEKESLEFYRDKSNKSGLSAYCKACKNEYNRQYYQRPEIKARQNEWVKAWNKKHKITEKLEEGLR